MEAHSWDASSRIEAILALFDDNLIDFCNTVARKQLTRAVWDNLPTPLRTDLEKRSLAELRSFPWCFREDDGEPLVHLSLAGLDNIGRAIHRCALPKQSSTPLPNHALCPAAKIGMTPKKVHECETFPAIIESVCSEAGGEICFDIGTGQGFFYFGSLIVCVFISWSRRLSGSDQLTTVRLECNWFGRRRRRAAPVQDTISAASGSAANAAVCQVDRSCSW